MSKDFEECPLCVNHNTEECSFCEDADLFEPFEDDDLPEVTAERKAA
jgi:hypothetical protein